mgnify:CR=1 FL=1
MAKSNVISEKSIKYALRIIDLYKYLSTEKKETVLSKQILRCGTSIGANIEESLGGSTRKDFLNKLSIAYKESRETKYWLILLYKSNYITKPMFDSMHKDCEELCKILSSIILTTKKSDDEKK